MTHEPGRPMRFEKDLSNISHTVKSEMDVRVVSGGDLEISIRERKTNRSTGANTSSQMVLGYVPADQIDALLEFIAAGRRAFGQDQDHAG